jgi:hypothetical protein
VEAVYKAFKVPFPTGVRQMATLGVREASMLRSGQSAAEINETEELAAKGKTAAEGGSGTATQARVKRTYRVGLAETIYDDTLYVVWTESKVNKDQRVEVFQCTIDPQTTSPSGQPYLLEGREYELMPYWHRTETKSYPNPHGGGSNQAFKVKNKGTRDTGKITLVRTHLKRFVKSRADLRHPDNIVHTRTGSSINMHFGSSSQYVRGASQGCTVLRHSLASGRYGHFVKTIVHRAKSPRPYLVVSSQYIRLYHEWVAYCDGDKKKAQDPRSVLKLDKLAQRKIGNAYVPTVIDVDFAKSNPDFVRRALFTVAD